MLCSLHRCSIFKQGANYSGSKTINVDRVLHNFCTLGDMEPCQGRFRMVMCIIAAEGYRGILDTLSLGGGCTVSKIMLCFAGALFPMKSDRQTSYGIDIDQLPADVGFPVNNTSPFGCTSRSVHSKHHRCCIRFWHVPRIALGLAY